MMYSREDDINLCKKYKINPIQLLLIKLYVDTPESLDEVSAGAKFMKNLYSFTKLFGLDLTKQPTGKTDKVKAFNERKDWFLKEVAGDLIDRDILIAPKTKPGIQVSLETYDICPNVIADFEADIYGMPDELSDAYPKRIKFDNGQFFYARNVAPEQFGVTYLRHIHNNREKHAKVIDLLEWGIETNNIKVGLDKFVSTRYWELLEEIREKGEENVGFSAELV
jgi:hypothetical protein